MIKALAIIFGVCVTVCASMFLLPVLVVLGVAVLLLSGFLAGAELVFVIIAAIAVVVATLIMMHVLVPLLVPLLVICGIVYIYKQLRAPQH